MTTRPAWHELTVNGVPATSLSPAGQQIFQKILVLQDECGELSKQFDQKQAALRELSDLVMGELTSLQAAETSETTVSSSPL